ncbi:phosphotransferase [Frankia sp. QA3]|uniref:phosphotransferase n=1 Tax=Frankia sp. QA3 TaxID=710111 RepID=UPI000269BF33|nr:phosphotransferase [Frankia sp. QA3]EIV91916.1 hypothetical protein FraQA3DRAFT_1401 [Frankia sp. QA3]
MVISWLEDHLGRVTAIERQPRWRPVWFADVERGGELLRLCVRGERADTDLVFPLAHEMRFQRVAHEHGIPVPAVHGWIDELPAFVMDRVPGRPDFPDLAAALASGAGRGGAGRGGAGGGGAGGGTAGAGGAGEADGELARAVAERDRVVDEYLRALAALHSVDVTAFAAAGIDRARQPEDSGLLGMRRFEELYRRQQVRPDPFLDFCLGWLRRHPPRSHGREAAVVWDSGQFHHAGGRLTALVDLELGHVGDPMMDLAGWRMRDSIMHYGDFDALYRRYGELVGEPVDLAAVQLHHIAFTLTNQLSFAHTLAEPPPASDYATNLQWCNETNLYATEAIAEYLGLELPGVEEPEVRDSPVAGAHGHLVRMLRTVQVDDPYARQQIRSAFRLANHLRRSDEIGDALSAADVDDVHRLLDRRPDGWRDAERELERFVAADADHGRHDAELLALFHRRNLRAQMRNGPAGSAMSRHIPIQPFAAPLTPHSAGF